MSDTEWNQALRIAVAAVTTAGAELKKHYGAIETQYKGNGFGVGAVVTELDRRTEEFLAQELGKFSSDIGFRGEEFGIQSHSKADTTWLVDPIDGTSHFV